MNGVKKILNSRFLKILSKIQRFILFVTNIALLLILGSVIIARDVFSTDFFGYDEIILISAMWLYFVGSAYGMKQEGHIKAEILALILPDHINRVLKVIVSFLETLISTIFTYFAFNLVYHSFTTWQITSAWGIPFFVPQSAILTGFILMTFYSGIYCVRDYYSLKTATNPGMVGNSGKVGVS